MGASTSSAQPQTLFTYSQQLTVTDQSIQAESNRLEAALRHFEATCREPAFRMNVIHLALPMDQHGKDAHVTDVWVGEVGLDFWIADQQRQISAWLHNDEMYCSEELSPIRNNADHAFWEALREGLGQSIERGPGLTGNRMAVHGGMLQVGRIVNEVVFQNERAGSVGAMDDLYRAWFSKSSATGQFLDKLSTKGGRAGITWIAGGVIGSYKDWQGQTYGNDMLKTGGVNIADAGIQGAMMLNPYTGAALLINAGVQIGGNLDIAADKLNANQYLSSSPQVHGILMSDAHRREEALGRADLGNVTKQLGEAIYESAVQMNIDAGKAIIGEIQGLVDDPTWMNLQVAAASLAQNEDVRGAMFANPAFMLMNPAGALMATSKTRKETMDIGGAAYNMVDGLADFAVASVASDMNQNLALGTKIVDRLPVDEQLKQNIDLQAKLFMARTSDMAQGYVDLSDPLAAVPAYIETRFNESTRNAVENDI